MRGKQRSGAHLLFALHLIGTGHGVLQGALAQRRQLTRPLESSQRPALQQASTRPK